MQTADQPILKTQGLTKRFGGLVAVSGLDLEIRPREILGLIGPNGAGKSTTFNLISGFYKPTAGDLYVFGENCTGRSPLTISRKGLVRTFQHGSLMRSMTVRDNILLGTIHWVSDAAARRQRMEETAAMLGLTAYLSEEAGTLPHGLQRLVSIGIALAPRPRLLCLDEPLTGLNQTEVTNTLTVLQRVRDEFGSSVLLVEHNMKAVMKVCDRITVLHHGQHLATGSPAQIRADRQVIDAYLGHRHDH
ncbi:ABC transporter ATP-binding protein [Mesorhizobium sp. YR577]|uniref:ABC transporter ATP-binding protein n=1 Tax=Mesorhizobium sp. YR577 TaxID=1884373 RepID=UPI0008EEF4A1|nr:ABC transporter ATP-binding protein [Mesorhizobium sp. YR577]SFU16946.1 amino acid/amide ABC transporter ATP-binding protein 1, HAAT family [Mesorhizobium sp. YR577]